MYCVVEVNLKKINKPVLIICVINITYFKLLFFLFIVVDEYVAAMSAQERYCPNRDVHNNGTLQN